VITYILIGITVAISFIAWERRTLMSMFMMNPYRIHRSHEYHRFITSGFIHKDHMHLLFNMFSFYFFGLAIENVFGQIFGDKGGIYFIVMYILAIIVSDLPSYFKHKDNPRYNSLGASGGVSAIIFAFIIFEPLADICIYIAFCMPGFILGTLYIGFSYYQGKKSNDNINHDAHLYGALFGFVFCAVLYPQSLPYFIDQIKHWDFLQKIF
jgi:membrane associated rhomboid family serine protease